MLKTTCSVNTNANTAGALIAFKPRQVLLTEHRTSTLTMTKKKQTETHTLNAEQKAFLLHSVIRYLENNGFPKTLKRILSEAQIQDEDWKASSLDLEDMCCKYLDICNRAETDVKTYKKEELQTEETTQEDRKLNFAATKELTRKKEKKRSEEGNKNFVADRSEATDRKITDFAKKSEEFLEDNVVSESEAKSKGRKKSKKSSDSSDKIEQVQSLVIKKQVENTESELTDELTKKSKAKKKKKSKSTKLDKEKMESMKVVAEEQSKDSAAAVCDVKNEKISSKKRKRLASDENEYQPDDSEANEESKRRKTKGLEESKKKNIHTINEGGKECKQENGQIGDNESHKTSKKQLDEHANVDREKNLIEKTNKIQIENANGNLQKSGDRSASQKPTRKQSNGSAEPKTVNAFQRVKIDEVEFADEKLQDNSYWAKDGAEIGYGAKAQEVLGQVRGRDFRHEKTKKKRGSYRGGLIDLQSRSVKFNYFDED